MNSHKGGSPGNRFPGLLHAYAPDPHTGHIESVYLHEGWDSSTATVVAVKPRYVPVWVLQAQDQKLAVAAVLEGSPNEAEIMGVLAAGANALLTVRDCQDLGIIEIINDGIPWVSEAFVSSLFTAARVLAIGPRRIGSLTDREVDVLALAAEGHSTKQIAAILFLSWHTVRNHFRRIHQKLHVKNRVEAIDMFREVAILRQQMLIGSRERSLPADFLPGDTPSETVPHPTDVSLTSERGHI